MQDLANIFIKSIFIDNMVFAYFLGMCSYLAISKTVKTSVGMGLAVIFVLSITVPINYLLVNYVLEKGALVWLGEEFKDIDLSFLSFIMFSSDITLSPKLNLPRPINNEGPRGGKMSNFMKFAKNDQNP